MSTTLSKKVIRKYILAENDSVIGGQIVKHTFVKKKWGYELWFVNNDFYCGKELHVKRKSQSSDGKFHYHMKKEETFYIIKGKLILEYIERESDLRKVVLKKGDSFNIKQYMPHRFSTGFFSCTFIEVSTHHEDNDSYYTEDAPEWFVFLNKK